MDPIIYCDGPHITHDIVLKIQGKVKYFTGSWGKIMKTAVSCVFLQKQMYWCPVGYNRHHESSRHARPSNARLRCHECKIKTCIFFDSFFTTCKEIWQEIQKNNTTACLTNVTSLFCPTFGIYSVPIANPYTYTVWTLVTVWNVVSWMYYKSSYNTSMVTVWNVNTRKCRVITAWGMIIFTAFPYSLCACICECLNIRYH